MKRKTDKFNGLNITCENGIYHIKYRFYKGNAIDVIKGHTFTLFQDYLAFATHCQMDRSFIHFGALVNCPDFNHGDGSIYEMIVDMNRREFWISHNYSYPVLLYRDIPSPLYPYVSVGYDCSLEILSATHEK